MQSKSVKCFDAVKRAGREPVEFRLPGLVIFL